MDVGRSQRDMVEEGGVLLAQAPAEGEEVVVARLTGVSPIFENVGEAAHSIGSNHSVFEAQDPVALVRKP
jgi:hypothetical protein